jgi:hypothetical protein
MRGGGIWRRVEAQTTHTGGMVKKQGVVNNKQGSSQLLRGSLCSYYGINCVSHDSYPFVM